MNSAVQFAVSLLAKSDAGFQLSRQSSLGVRTQLKQPSLAIVEERSRKALHRQPKLLLGTAVTATALFALQCVRHLLHPSRKSLSSAFACELAELCKTIQSVFTKFGGKVAHRPRQKRLDFDGNPDHVTLNLNSTSSICCGLIVDLL